jgi:DNA-binding transcriptional MerR regulator
MARKSSSPKRLYYKIGEACKLLDIQPYVLRYWETEFPDLAPSKSRSGQRVYTEAELGIIRRIKELLYDEGFTIAGAKKRLEMEAGGSPPRRGNGDEAEVAAAEPAAAAPEELDTRTAERIERLRAGIGEAVKEARQLLALLDSKPN